MKTVSINLQNLKELVADAYYKSLNNLKMKEKSDKRYFKKLQKRANGITNNLSESISFFNISNDCTYENIFLVNSLQINAFTTNPISFLKYLDVKELKKDKTFVIFLKNIILLDLIYQESINKTEVSKYIFELQSFYGDIRKVFLSYFLLKEKNITLIKFQNITSYVLKGADFYYSYLTIPKNKQELFQQIITGVKYEKLKPESVNNIESRPYNKKEKFDILQIAKNSIRIKIISNKNGRHQTHASPIPHERKGHYRHYKNGKVVWINSMRVAS